jgi:TonB-dependent receptor
VARDTTGSQSYGFLFPQATARLRLTDFLDLRAAVTRNLARPDYLQLVAFENVNDIDFEIERGNPGLRATTAWNYDAGLTAFSRLGLFSVGAFYKRLTDFQYDSVTPETFEGRRFDVFQTVNGEDATVAGVEVEVQTNTRWLSQGPLGGFTINANYTYSHSEARYPVAVPLGLDLTTFQSIEAVEVRRDRLVGQSPHIVSAGVGYERGPVAVRLNATYQSDFLLEVTESSFVFEGGRPQFDPETGFFTNLIEVRRSVEQDAVLTVDAQASLRLRPLGRALRGARLTLNAANLTDAAEANSFENGQLVFERFYGRRVELGLRYDF